MSFNADHRSLRKRISSMIWGEGMFSGKEEKSDSKKRHLLLETLEKRALLAGDVELLFTDNSDASGIAEENTAEIASSPFGGQLEFSGQAEGEAAPDLVQFAKDLTTAGVKFFGAAWCSFCTDQKQLFQDGGEFLPFIEVSNPDRSLNATGVAENIETFPTWEFPDSSRETGVLSLQTLSDRSGVAIAQSELPSFLAIGDQIAEIGSPLHIPVDAYSPTGEALTVTVSVDDPSLLEATVLSGNRSIRINLAGYDDMVFELFEQRAETASGRVIALAEDNFYDGIIFHRVVDGFVIQGGDPTGTGTSGSNLGTFDDDFHPELQHNREGVLSFAKSSDDTNNSQFFVTEVPTRFLDFNHSVFGQLVEGFDVREAISQTATNSSSRPINDVTMTTVDVFDDTENSVVMLKPTGAGSGTTAVTFTVTDQSGNVATETIQVSVTADSSNSQPYLNDITSPITSSINTPAELQLSSVDIEGDAVSYFAQSLSSASNGSVSVDANTGLVTVTPANDFIGTITVQVGVAPGPGVTGNGVNDSDTQRVSFVFEANSLPAPSAIDLSSGSDSGTSSTDNITNNGSLAFLVSGVTSGATVTIIDTTTSTVVGTGTATDANVIITTNNIAALGDGSYQLAAYQSIGNTFSPDSPTLKVIYDTTPPASVIGSAATQANVGRPFSTDLISNEEGSGITYSVNNPPTGLSIEPSTGAINWTPVGSQLGDHSLEIVVTDTAGNQRTETLTITVGEAPTAEVRLDITDTDGNAISTVAVGETFLVKMVAIDARAFSQPGIYGAYADIIFDPALIQPDAVNPIQYDSGFGLLQKGTVQTNQIDELGAVSSSIVASNVAESHIATLRFTAISGGTVNLRSEPADDVNSEFLMFGIDEQIAASAINYGSTNLTIGQSFSVADDQITMAEDSLSTEIDVLSNDQVLSGTGALTVISITQPTDGGTATLDSGVVSFTPLADFFGSVDFTYRVSDTQGIQQTGNVTVTVEPVNDPPSGIPDTITVNENSGNNFLNVLINDSVLPDSDETLRVVSLSPAGTTDNGGSITIAPDGAGVFYQPATDFSGTDSFTYTVSDGSLEEIVNVSVTVTNPDNPPTANDDTFNITEDDAESSLDILANDSQDVDGQAFIIESVGTPDAGGNARISEDGLEFYYQPAANFNGTESLTYLLRDSGGGSAVGTITVNVQSVNDAPPATDLTFTRNRGGDNQELLTIADLPTNPDAGETLTITVQATTAANGVAQVEPITQTILYTPPIDFVGTDTISYTVSDGSDLTSSGTITVEVTDYEPRVIQLTLPQSPSELTIAEVTLQGTDLSGNSVQETIDYGDDAATFDDLMPGQYTIRIPAIPFFQNAEQPKEIPVSSDSDDGDTTVESGIGRLRPEFISIRDWLRSTPKNSILTAIAPGQSSVMVSESSQANLNSPDVKLDGSSSLITVEHIQISTDENSQSTSTPVRSTFDANDQSIVQRRGEINGLVLFKISTNQLTFTPVGEGTSGAEGEQAATAPPLSLPNPSNPEGESVAHLFESPNNLNSDINPSSSNVNDLNEQTLASVTVADIFVPMTTSAQASNQSLAMPMPEGEKWIGRIPNAETLQSNTGTQARPVDAALESIQTDLAIDSRIEKILEDDDLADQVLADQTDRINAIDRAINQPL